MNDRIIFNQKYGCEIHFDPNPKNDECFIFYPKKNLLLTRDLRWCREGFDGGWWRKGLQKAMEDLEKAPVPPGFDGFSILGLDFREIRGYSYGSGKSEGWSDGDGASISDVAHEAANSCDRYYTYAEISSVCTEEGDGHSKLSQ